MKIPTSNGEEQGSDMAANRGNLGTNKDISGVETSNSILHSAESPLEGHNNKQRGAMIGESHDDSITCGQQTQAKVSREGQHGRDRAVMIEESHAGDGLFGLQAPADEAESEGLGMLVITDDVTQNEAQYTNREQTQASPRTTKIPSPVPARLTDNVRNTPTPLPLEPPVTRAALSGLEVRNIIYNPKFRHDINFIRGLVYQPTFEGEWGLQKLQQAAEFWKSLHIQISQFMSNTEVFQAEHPENTWTLPAILKAISEIFMTIVPSEDRPALEESLNIDFLMQQLSKGVLNLVQLAERFSIMLRSHCAPKRDQWVYDMVKQFRTGSRNGDATMLVAGLQSLLGIVEAMRLDVINHQIRCLIPVLIYDTVAFQQAVNLKKHAQGHINILKSHDWFESYRGSNLIPALSHELEMWTFFQGFVDLLRVSNTDCRTPDTLELDKKRIAKLRSDILDAVNVEVCMFFFRMLNATTQTANGLQSKTLPATPASLAAGTKVGRDLAPKESPAGDTLLIDTALHTDQSEAYLRSALFAIVEDAATVAFNSPSRSPLSPVYCDRWKSAAPSLALEILRNTAMPLSTISSFEKTLAGELSSSSIGIFRMCEKAVLGHLGKLIKNYVTAWEPLNNHALFVVATKEPKYQPPLKIHMLPPNALVPNENDLMDSVARRAAHIGILNWRIWAEIAYVIDPNDPIYYGLGTDSNTSGSNSD